MIIGAPAQAGRPAGHAPTTDVLLAEPQAIVRAGIRRLIEAFGGYRVVGETDDGLDALRLAEEQRPDVAIVELRLRGLGGVELLGRMARSSLPTRGLVLCDQAGADSVRQALQAGALGYVVKSAPPQALDELRWVVAGRRWLSPEIGALAPAEGLPGGGSATLRLTERQREIVRLIAEGMRTCEIAERLGLSPKTIESHRVRIMQRLHIYDVAGLTRFAIRAGLVSLDA